MPQIDAPDLSPAPWIVSPGDELWAIQLPDGRIDLTTVHAFHANVAIHADNMHQVVRLRLEMVDIDAPPGKRKRRWW